MHFEEDDYNKDAAEEDLEFDGTALGDDDADTDLVDDVDVADDTAIAADDDEDDEELDVLPDDL